jgi:hypothetical protein
VRYRLLLVAVLVLSGCGDTKVVQVTKTVSAPPRTCERIGDSGLVLCEHLTPRTGTAFYRWNRGRLSAFPVVRPPGSKVGHWVTAFLSPDRKTLLAQWSAECEVPIAYFIALKTGETRAVARGNPESVAHGWAGDGRAIVEFPNGLCGRGTKRPGLYLVSLDGTRTLLAPTLGTRRRIG